MSSLDPIRNQIDKSIEITSQLKMLLGEFRDKQLEEHDELERTEEYKNRIDELEIQNKELITIHDTLRESVEKYINAKESGKVYDFQWNDVLAAFNAGYYFEIKK